MGERGKPVLAFFDGVALTMFNYTDFVMMLTPLGVFGAMAYTVNHMAACHSVNGVLLKGWPAMFHLLKQYSLLVGSLNIWPWPCSSSWSSCPWPDWRASAASAS